MKERIIERKVERKFVHEEFVRKFLWVTTTQLEKFPLDSVWEDGERYYSVSSILDFLIDNDQEVILDWAIENEGVTRALINAIVKDAIDYENYQLDRGDSDGTKKSIITTKRFL